MLFSHLTVRCIVVTSIVLAPYEEAPRRPPFVEQYLNALEDSDCRVRWQAAQDLAQLEVVSSEIVMRIVEIARRRRNEDKIETHALMALELLGAKAAPAIPFLTIILLDDTYPPSSNSSYLAGRALVSMGPAAAPAIPSLLKAVFNK